MAQRKVSEMLNISVLEKERLYDGKTRKAISELRRQAYPQTFEDAKRKRETDLNKN